MRPSSIDALWDHVANGRLDDAAAVAARLLDTAPDDALRAEVESALGLMYRRVGRLAESGDSFWHAASRVPPGAEQASFRADAAISLLLAGQLDRAEVAARAAIDDGDRFNNPTARCRGLAALGIVHHARGDPTQALVLAQRALALDGDQRAHRDSDPLCRMAAATALMDLDRHEDAESALTIGLAGCASSGADAEVAWLLSLRCFGRALAGRIDEALADGTEALAVAETSGALAVRPLCWGVMASLRASRGDLSGAEDLLRAGGRNRLGAFSGWGEEWLLVGRATVAGSRTERFDRLAEAWHHGHGLRWFLSWRMIAPPLVEAALSVGEDAYAAKIADEVVEGARRAGGVASAEAVALHCTGLVRSDPVAIAGAVAAYRRSGRPLLHGTACLDAARVHCARGDAAGALALAREAEEVLRPLRMAAWSARVATLLSQLAKVPARGPAQSLAMQSLTPSEREIARLTAEGLTNGEIAGILGISPRTVQTHLGHVYDKLGLTSRVQLATLVSLPAT